MKWNDTLDEVMGNKLKIRIVRTLLGSGRALTGKKIAQSIGYSHTQTYKALNDLEYLGIVMKDYAGASSLYSVNTRSYVTSEILIPALEAEKKMLRMLASRFYEGMGKDLLSITMFGSAARGEDELTSDIDLILVVKDRADLDYLDDHAAEISIDAGLEFGGPVSAFVIPECRYRERLSEGKAMWGDVKKEGIMIPRADREVRKAG